ncbi:shikimate O-hydroxycinnamoyltransferase-like [Rutidosis leptorrhynchoides]|uniref:shikimate O-hydroxycinnamoyltransferase-like n=1 Tax=Rutidosis leptorrhynchoides TaxID=125765 RepID=UPI003A9A2524
MNIFVRESTMVYPAEKTRSTKLWISNLDLMVAHIQIPCVYFYRPNSASNFFDIKVMKEALSRALVPFYPMAGRMKEDKDGRIELDCQGQGVLFVEAESNGVIDDLGDFAPTLEVQKLIPVVDYSLGLESSPLLLVQVTNFKCGGVCVGVSMHHVVVDGVAGFNFINTWSDMARGLNLNVPPIMDRTLLRARHPPQPMFKHVEYQPTKTMAKTTSDEIAVSVYKLTRDQLNVLKRKFKQDNSMINYSTFELLSGHIWKCASTARGLPVDQETKLYVHVDARARLKPALSVGYFGNAVLTTTPVALAGEIQSNTSWYAASKVHDILTTMNNDYVRSTIDYLELSDVMALTCDIAETYKSSNFAITSWTTLPIHDADFGWGRPIFMGPGGITLEGLAFVLPSPVKDGSLSIVISLQAQHMRLFRKLFYELFLINS